jgi:hypothetical protein
VNKSLDEADHADVSKQTLISYSKAVRNCRLQKESGSWLTEGRPLIPAAEIAITNGDAAVPEFNLSDVLLDGTRRPMTKVPPI